jgi:hypothetical protein
MTHTRSLFIEWQSTPTVNSLHSGQQLLLLGVVQQPAAAAPPALSASAD